MRFCDYGHQEIINNEADPSLGADVLAGKNYLFCGSHAGGERAVAI